MSRSPNGDGPEHSDQAMLKLLQVLSAGDRSVLRPTAPLWERLERRLAEETSEAPPIALEDASTWKEPEWRQAAPGLWYQLLSEDRDTHRVTMLVRLEWGAEYPSHVHAGVEELYLLDGELWIDNRKLHPGDYSRAEPGTGDKRVWSETGCTCVLITSAHDVMT